jgi:hypothetical protein
MSKYTIITLILLLFVISTHGWVSWLFVGIQFFVLGIQIGELIGTSKNNKY